MEGLILGVRPPSFSQSNLWFNDNRTSQVLLFCNIGSKGAFALLIIDPIEMEADFGSIIIQFRDSSFSLGIDARSSGSFSASVQDLLNNSFDFSVLNPAVVVPLEVEFVFDLTVYDNVTITPILHLDIDDLLVLEGGFDFAEDFTIDVDLAIFLEGQLGGNDGLEPVFDDLSNLLNNISQYGPNFTMTNTSSSAVEGLFAIVEQVEDFAGGLSKFIDIVGDVQDLLDPQVLSLMRHVGRLSKNGCTSLSDSFASFSHDLLYNSNPQLFSGTLEEFDPCQYLGEIQHVLFETAEIADDVTLDNLVAIPGSLDTKISEVFGTQLDINEIIDFFQTTSLRRLMNFISEFLADNSNIDSSRRRRLSSQAPSVPLAQGMDCNSMHRRRLDLIHDVRKTGNTLLERHRRRNLEETVIATIPVGDYLKISFSFNFGDGVKEVLIKAEFDFQSGEELVSEMIYVPFLIISLSSDLCSLFYYFSGATDLQTLFEGFIQDTLGKDDTLGEQFDDGKGSFSFQEQAQELANSLLNSTVIDASAQIVAAFGLDLSKVFDDSETDNLKRIPSPFLKIETFDLAGTIGVQDWSASLGLTSPITNDITFGIAEADALIDVNITINGNDPVVIDDPSDFGTLIGSDSPIDISASVTVDFPIFVLIEGVSLRFKA